MGYDRVHCSTQCREDTEKQVMAGSVPGWVEFANFWRRKEEEESAARQRAEAARRLQEARQQQQQEEDDESRAHQAWARSSHEYDNALLYNGVEK
jgi:hypothetical protein